MRERQSKMPKQSKPAGLPTSFHIGMHFPKGSYKILLLLQWLQGGQWWIRHFLISSPPISATVFFFNDAPIHNIALYSLGPQNLLSEFTVRTTDIAIAQQCLPPSGLSPLDAWGRQLLRTPCSSFPAQRVMIIMTLCKWRCRGVPQRDFSDVHVIWLNSTMMCSCAQ